MIILLQIEKKNVLEKNDMMTVIMQSLQYIRLESLKVSSRVENTLKKKEHVPYFEVSI